MHAFLDETGVDNDANPVDGHRRFGNVGRLGAGDWLIEDGKKLIDGCA